MPIICIERVLVAVADLDASCERWRRAGFALARDNSSVGGIRSVRMGAGAVAIDLCADDSEAPEPFSAALARGGGIIGWVWGTTGGAQGDNSLTNFLPGVWTTSVPVEPDPQKRRTALLETCGSNENTADYLEHIVVMSPSLQDAIAAHEKLGLPCKRIREAGGGIRQAFFKLEQTVLEIVGPAKGNPQVWGLAFMCTDIERAVRIARSNGLQATEPKPAVQGGRIARIVEPLDGVAIAFMEPSANA